ncbi:tryptophan halogenase [Aurantiacibacter luteus]|uniref:Tryptophan halogenase n=2 Tax=Aurantiacibacter luteus TaxID=1581420 RepID=A0A0G9N041_9SPHN|nr:tryptophan halogenase [Aurantiacibacter luteus]
MDKGAGTQGYDPVRNVVIVGGGTAGWMAAAALSRFLGRDRTITLVESDAIGIVGVGEATIPPIRTFNSMLDIAEEDFLRETRGTFKLGIEFVNWGRVGDRYMHPFGAYGQDFHGVPFHQMWLRYRALGGDAGLEDFSMCIAAAHRGKFGKARPGEPTPLQHIAWAYHFDAGLYARFLRGIAEQQGVVRREGRIVAFHRDGESGDVTSVEFEGGTRLAGDLFLDCSGFRGLLIEEALETGWEDWSHWLPMDSALAVPTANTEAPAPFTRSTAHAAGWQWRIPLQHRTGNGHVFCSAHTDADQAERTLRENVEGDLLADPRMIRFTTGMRRQAWNHNVVSLGLASGFIEPLESTSIHLIQHGVLRLIGLFPDRKINPTEREEYNRNLRSIFEFVRDFVILHYKANQREDSVFWRQMAAMSVPDTLQHRMDLWQAHGRVFPKEADMFNIPSWVAVMLGQNVTPDRYDPVADALVEKQLTAALADMRTRYAETAGRLPSHETYLQKVGAWA